MDSIKPLLTPIDRHLSEALQELQAWVAINSFSDHIPGLERMADRLTPWFASFGANVERHATLPRQIIDQKGDFIHKPHGPLLRLTMRPAAPRQVLLVGHMDTVYPPEKETKLEIFTNDIWKGPGVADMKGGIMVLWLALQALEQSTVKEGLGWELLLTPDEEVGSFGSLPFLEAAAKRCQFGLIFEPAFPDGSIVNQRKGSANFTIIARGRSAHAGRDFYVGRNAIMALSKCIIAIESLSDRSRGITYNVGAVHGGGPVNVVPDLAFCKVNVRMNEEAHLAFVRETLNNLVAGLKFPDGISVQLYEGASRPPKEFDPVTEECFHFLEDCGRQLGMELGFCSSGGVCDGNFLAAAGLPTIDSLGVVGGELHTPDEYMIVSSVRERARLSATFLLELAQKPLRS